MSLLITGAVLLGGFMGYVIWWPFRARDKTVQIIQVVISMWLVIPIHIAWNWMIMKFIGVAITDAVMRDVIHAGFISLATNALVHLLVFAYIKFRR